MTLVVPSLSDRFASIPKDKAARDRLATFAGLTDEEREALDAWCYEQAEEDHRRQRRGLEEHGDDVLGGRHHGSDRQDTR